LAPRSAAAIKAALLARPDDMGLCRRSRLRRVAVLTRVNARTAFRPSSPRQQRSGGSNRNGVAKLPWCSACRLRLSGRRYLLLWQEAGRSAAGPVHCPLWPAPLPPLVGGDGLANAGAAEPTRIPPATIAATTARFMCPSCPKAKGRDHYAPNQMVVPFAGRVHHDRADLRHAHAPPTSVRSDWAQRYGETAPSRGLSERSSATLAEHRGELVQHRPDLRPRRPQPP
jgi:hypothetical protein